MEQKPLDVETVIDDWLRRCGAFLGQVTEPPYLDGDFPELDNNLPFDPIQIGPERTQGYIQALERRLITSPTGLVVRFGSLCNPAPERKIKSWSAPDSPSVTGTCAFRTFSKASSTKP